MPPYQTECLMWTCDILFSSFRSQLADCFISVSTRSSQRPLSRSNLKTPHFNSSAPTSTDLQIRWRVRAESATVRLYRLRVGYGPAPKGNIHVGILGRFSVEISAENLYSVLRGPEFTDVNSAQLDFEERQRVGAASTGSARN